MRLKFSDLTKNLMTKKTAISTKLNDSAKNIMKFLLIMKIKGMKTLKHC